MTEREIKLSSLSKEKREIVRDLQNSCGCCRCYGMENCGEHAIKLREFNITIEMRRPLGSCPSCCGNTRRDKERSKR